MMTGTSQPTESLMTWCYCKGKIPKEALQLLIPSYQPMCCIEWWDYLGFKIVKKSCDRKRKIAKCRMSTIAMLTMFSLLGSIKSEIPGCHGTSTIMSHQIQWRQNPRMVWHRVKSIVVFQRSLTDLEEATREKYKERIKILHSILSASCSREKMLDYQ